MLTNLCAAIGCVRARRPSPYRAQAESGLLLCPGCRDRIGTDLAELPSLYDDCESLLSAAPKALTEKVRGRVATDLSLNQTAVSVRSDIVVILASWAGLIASERGVARPARRDVGVLAAFVTVHLDWLLTHPAAADFAEEVTALAKAARRAAQPGDRIHLELGQCIRPGCESMMFATTHGDGGISLTGLVRCESGHVWKAHQWLPLAHQLEKTGRRQRGSAHES